MIIKPDSSWSFPTQKPPDIGKMVAAKTTIDGCGTVEGIPVSIEREDPGTTLSKTDKIKTVRAEGRTTPYIPKFDMSSAGSITVPLANGSTPSSSWCAKPGAMVMMQKSIMNISDCQQQGFSAAYCRDTPKTEQLIQPAVIDQSKFPDPRCIVSYQQAPGWIEQNCCGTIRKSNDNAISNVTMNLPFSSRAPDEIPALECESGPSVANCKGRGKLRGFMPYPNLWQTLGFSSYQDMYETCAPYASEMYITLPSGQGYGSFSNGGTQLPTPETIFQTPQNLICGTGKDSMNIPDCRRTLTDALLNRDKGPDERKAFEKYRDVWREYCGKAENFPTAACQEFCLHTDELGHTACNNGFSLACQDSWMPADWGGRQGCFTYFVSASPTMAEAKLRDHCTAGKSPSNECFGSDSYVCDRRNDDLKPGEKGNRYGWCNSELQRLCASSAYASPLCKCLVPGTGRDMFCRSTLASCRSGGYVLHPRSPCPDICVDYNVSAGGDGGLGGALVERKNTTVICSSTASGQKATITTPGTAGDISQWAAWWRAGNWADLTSSGYTITDAVEECIQAIKKSTSIVDLGLATIVIQRVLINSPLERDVLTAAIDDQRKAIYASENKKEPQPASDMTEQTTPIQTEIVRPDVISTPPSSSSAIVVRSNIFALLVVALIVVIIACLAMAKTVL